MILWVRTRDITKRFRGWRWFVAAGPVETLFLNRDVAEVRVTFRYGQVCEYRRAVKNPPKQTGIGGIDWRQHEQYDDQNDRAIDSHDRAGAEALQ